MPQIELMQADLPHTLYNTKNKERTTVSEECEELNRQALERARKRHAKPQADKSLFTLEEIFNGADES